MSEEWACPKCKKAFHQDNPPKKLINCSHNLCFPCLKEELVCPIDRTRIEKRKYTIQAFHTNQDLLNSISLSKNASNPNINAKSNHSHTHNGGKPQSQSNSANNTKLEFTTPIVSKFSQKGFRESEGDSVEVEVSCVSPERQNKGNKLAISPKRVRLNFDICLLHSKKADLVCLQDRCLICASCGLFGQHKSHKIIPYDQFLTQYSRVTEEAFRLYQQLKQREEKVSQEALSSVVEQALKERRDIQAKNIRTSIAAYIDSLRRLEKQLMVELDIALGVKRRKLMEGGGLAELAAKKDRYIGEIETMSNGVDDIFNLQNIGHYIDYIDKDSPNSFIINQGEYLLVEIDNYHRTHMQAIAQETADIHFEFTLPFDSLRDTVAIHSQDATQIGLLIEQARKKQPKSSTYKNSTPNRVINNPPMGSSLREKVSPQMKGEEDLLIGSNSKSGSKGSSGKGKEHSPIQPCSFDFDLARQVQLSSKCDYSSLKQVQFKPPLLPINQFSAGPSLSRCRLDSSRTHKSKPKSIQSHSDREVMILTDKNQNIRKRKLELPEKYQRIYEELQRDRLQVLDLGGAFLGENTILAISQLFTSRSRLKIAKLMNNKIGDQSFPELVRRCRLLTSLNLSYNLLTEKSLQWLEDQAEQLGELKNITLSNNKIVLRNVRDRLQGLARRGIKVSL